MSLTAALLEMMRANPVGTFIFGVIVSVIAGFIIGGSGFRQNPGRKIPLGGAFYGAAIMCFILITGEILHIWVLVS